jgi:5-formaminoimidazole-4-carboxamide-1-beta-D-ribofuranosyl 5'-monophosphate synthetase
MLIQFIQYVISFRTCYDFFITQMQNLEVDKFSSRCEASLNQVSRLPI